MFFCKRFNTVVFATGILIFLSVSSVHANGYGNLYDMSKFLNQPHPFTLQTPFYQSTPTNLSNQSTFAPRAQQPFSSAPAKKKIIFDEKTPSIRAYGWLSEVRAGVLKHAISFGNKTKETGIDANLEVLFISPGWLKYIMSPRPHIGFSVNGSSNNTDYAYGGLTWEWLPWETMFIDFSFGVAGHNGKHADDANSVFPSNVNRQREMGCSVSFRESLEIGFILAEHHGISVVWDHLSNGGLCSQNEGLDNLGIRYGYRF